jgi:hypothetical protein
MERESNKLAPGVSFGFAGGAIVGVILGLIGTASQENIGLGSARSPVRIHWLHTKSPRGSSRGDAG